jgi:hypothetical protein
LRDFFTASWSSVVRRLPVLQTPVGDDAEAEARPAWQWVVIGAGLVLVLFLPLAILAGWVASRLATRFPPGGALAALAGALPIALAHGLAAASAGAFIGRFGRRAGTRSVLLAGGLGGAATLVLAALGGALSPWTVALGAGTVLIGGGCIFALLGARFGRRKRA